MPGRHQSERDTLTDIYERLKDLESAVRLLSSNPNPSLPIYGSGDDPDDMYDGMAWLQNNGVEASFNYRLQEATWTLQGQ